MKRVKKGKDTNGNKCCSKEDIERWRARELRKEWNGSKKDEKGSE